MLPSSNKGVGMNIGFPDICITPIGPVPTPIPYPNFGMNILAEPFSDSVMLSMVPALNMLSEIPETLGDEAGTQSPNSGAGRYTMGNPMVLIEEIPGINLLCPTTGNNFINMLGAVLVPSITNVFFTDMASLDGNAIAAAHGASVQGGEVVHVGRHSPAERAGLTTGSRVGAVEATDDGCRIRLGEDWVQLRKGCSVQPVAWRQAGSQAIVEISSISADLVARLHAVLEACAAARVTSIVLDLRNNGGGPLIPALEAAGLFVPRGTPLCRVRDGDGDERVVASRTARPVTLPIAVLVNQGTASSAEILAAALQAAGRAVVVGGTTFGKAVATCRNTGRGGPADQCATMEVMRPDGRAIHGCGVGPDIVLADAGPASSTALAAALSHAEALQDAA